MKKHMTITYDRETDILNVTLGDVKNRRRPGCEVWENKRGGTEVVFDVTPDGDILYIEILNASRKYPKEDLEMLPPEFPWPVALKYRMQEIIYADGVSGPFVAVKSFWQALRQGLFGK